MATGFVTPPLTPPPGFVTPSTRGPLRTLNPNQTPPRNVGSVRRWGGRNNGCATPRKSLTVSSRYLDAIRNIEVCSLIPGVGQIGHRIGEGQFSEVFEIEGQPGKVLKRYQDHHLTTDREVRERIDYVLEQYGILREIAPAFQATIYNADTAIEDGYLVVERIPLAFPTPIWTHETRLEDLSSTDMRILEQVKALFQILANNNLMVDLKNDNVGLNDDSNVILFDWHDVPNERDAFWANVANRVNSFARGNDGRINQKIYGYLYPRQPLK